MNKQNRLHFHYPNPHIRGGGQIQFCGNKWTQMIFEFLYVFILDYETFCKSPFLKRNCVRLSFSENTLLCFSKPVSKSLKFSNHPAVKHKSERRQFPCEHGHPDQTMW